jgi:hypothetical protein
MGSKSNAAPMRIAHARKARSRQDARPRPTPKPISGSRRKGLTPSCTSQKRSVSDVVVSTVTTSTAVPSRPSARPDQKLRPSGAVSDIRTRGEIIEACEGNGGPEQPREDAVKGLVQRQAEADAVDVDHAVARTKPTA